MCEIFMIQFYYLLLLYVNTPMKYETQCCDTNFVYLANKIYFMF